MRNKSWEIIVAGLLLLVVAILVTSKGGGDGRDSEEEYVSSQATSTPKNRESSEKSITVINVEELAKMEELKELEKLKSLEGLKKLKSLASLIPNDAKNEILNEVNAALSELEDDSFSINIDMEEGLVTLQKEYKVELGKWSDVSPGVYAFTEKFDASGLSVISVNLSGGSVVLVGSDEEQASFTVKASGEIAARELLEEMVSVTTEKNGSKADFKVNNDRSNNSNIQLQTTLLIPSNIDVVSFTDGGHIEATNFQGDVEFKTSGGHITLKDLSGDITAFTEGGHIKLSDSEGDASLKSLGGHLSASNFTGDLEMRTSGGNIFGSKLSGSANAFSSGGNIKLQFLNVGGDIQARNGAGQIDLLLPENVNANLTANGTKIEIAKELFFNGERKKNQATGKFGTGGFDIILKTGYGTVLIQKNE